jgi:hypothetical protein
MTEARQRKLTGVDLKDDRRLPDPIPEQQPEGLRARADLLSPPTTGETT